MIYLVIGVDRSTLAPWRESVRARDAATAEELARSRAGEAGVDLVVAAALGPDT